MIDAGKNYTDVLKIGGQQNVTDSMMATVGKHIRADPKRTT